MKEKIFDLIHLRYNVTFCKSEHLGSITICIEKNGQLFKQFVKEDHCDDYYIVDVLNFLEGCFK